MAALDLSDYSERVGHLTAVEEAETQKHFREHPPCDTNGVRAWLQETYAVAYSRPGAIKLMHRLGFDWKRPERLPKLASTAAQKAYIARYESLKNGLPPDAKVVFVDAVHPEHQSRPTH